MPASLTTQRLVLRPWRAADRAPFAELNADPVVMRHYPATRSRSESDAFVTRIEALFDEHGFGLYALERRDDGRFLGYTGLLPMPDWSVGAGGWEIGWRLAQHAWGQGYATEAATAVRDHAAQVLALPELWSHTAVTNVASQRVMQRIGMSEHSRFEHPELPADHRLRPHVTYHLTTTQDAR